jgi:hypothetical protein
MLMPSEPEDIPLSGACSGLVYVCRNCGAPFHVWFWWQYVQASAPEGLDALKKVLGPRALNLEDWPSGVFTFQKAGQLPAPSVSVPRDLSQALGAHAELYRRALVCRNQGFGIGAHAYLRRVVEETMNEWLELLVAALTEGGADAETIKRVETAKRERVFERKADVAADALPDRLKPGEFNPFTSLHSLYSEHLHGKTDQECIAIVDQMRREMDIIFKTLKTHVADRKGYREASASFQKKRAPKPPKS